MKRFAVLEHGIRNEVNCDYVGDVTMLIHPINAQLNRVFLDYIKKRLFFKLNHFPDIFISLYVETIAETKKVAKIGLNYVFRDELYGKDVNFEDSDIIQNEINSYLENNGFDINNPISFIEKLYNVVPSLANYIKIVEE